MALKKSVSTTCVQLYVSVLTISTLVQLASDPSSCFRSLEANGYELGEVINWRDENPWQEVASH